MFRLDRLLNKAKRRIQRERLLKGVAILLAYLLVAVVLSTYFLASSNFSTSTIFWCRIWFGAGLLFLFWRFILDAVLRPPARSRVARFLEERNPELQQRLTTAVEVSEQPSLVHPDLARLIEEDAYRQLSRREQPRFYWPQFSMASALIGLLSLFVVTGLLFWGPDEFRYGMGKLLGSWVDDTTAPLYGILVDPGNTRVSERADVEVSAIPKGFEPSQVQVFALYPNTPQWQSTNMLSATDGAGYSFLFFDVREPIEYYVDADGIRSETFRIEVADIPRADRVRISLEFPKYTGLSEVVLDDETYVRALQGTQATLYVHSDQTSPAGLLKFEESDREIALEKRGPNDFEASFQIDRDDYFRIHLESSEGILNPASDEFTVEAIQDQPPVISFNYPGRDRPVTNIEEVYSEIRAEDDYGLRSVTLNFSINGGEDQTAEVGSPRGSKDFTGSHTFYLEEYELQPGDFISYYARAADAVASSTTDIFFLEVENFDREFRQSQMNMGNAAGQRGLELSRQQKQIVVATFSLIEEGRPTKEEMTEDSQTLALVQQRLQAQAQAIVDRLERRGVTGADPRFKAMAEYMGQAIEHMKPSETALNAVDPSGALPEAKKALQNLLRAEKLFNEVQVSMSNSSEGGSSPEELADLVDLELDRTKNQYETLQKNRQEQKDQQLDEALEKLKELARRQEQEIERQRRQATTGQGGGQASQQDLIDEMERLSRELARLSRDKANEQLSRISRELSRAARDLRNAQASGKDSSESLELARQALERLKQAQEGLSSQRQSEVAQEMAELTGRAEKMVEAQDEVLRDLRSIPKPPENGEPSSEFYESIRDLYWKKQGLQKDLQELESQLHQTARRLGGDEPEAAKRLKSAGLQIRDQRIPDKMREGSELIAGGLLPFAERRERDVAEELRQLAEKVRDAREGLGASSQGQEDRLRQALGEAGKLVENLESMKRRLEQASSGQNPGEPGSSTEQSDREAREQGSRPGTQQGEAGKPGESSGNRPPSGEPREQSPGQGSQGTAPQTSEMAGGFSSQGIDPGSMRREWDQRLDEAKRVRQALSGVNPELGREATRLLQQMLQADLERILSDPGEVARLKSSVIDGFHELELLISRSLKDEKDDYLRPVNEDEVPPEFRDRVEEYYRRLSSARNP